MVRPSNRETKLRFLLVVALQGEQGTLGGLSNIAERVGELFVHATKRLADFSPLLDEVLVDRHAAQSLCLLALASSPAEAKGCIKGAIVDGVAGHMAGHGKLGAAAGCVVGHHEANKPNPNNSNAQVPLGQK